MDEKLNPKDKVLLMRDEGEGNKLKVVKGIDKKGKIDAIDPMKAKQSDFIKIDKHADPIENFFKNFFNQAKNPSHTGFYAVTVDMLDKILHIKEEDLQKYRINPKDYMNQQEQSTKESERQVQPEKKEEKMDTASEQKTEFKQFDTNRIPESEYQKYGIKPENLEGELKAMSYGYKSPHLVDINPKIEGVDYPMKARLSLEEQPDGSLKFTPHPYQNQVDLEKPFQGIMLPNDVRENLLATGNSGRVVELQPTPNGEKVPSLVSIDKLTNRLEAVPLDKLTVSQNLKGTELSPEQQQALKEGKKVLVEGMTSKKTIGTDNPRKFDAYVQFNAAKGGYDFSYDGLDRNKYQQNNKQQQNQNGEQQNNVRIPKKLLGVDLSEDQQSKLRENKAVYVQGMVKDGKGEPFNAYVKVNTEKANSIFSNGIPTEPKSREQK
ncbi:MAG: DUF3945 domain-containing protein [Bacteroides thetaiotaomicron]